MPITYNCLHCSHRITSLLISREEAVKDAGMQLAQHLQKDHPQEVAQLQKDIQSAIPLMIGIMGTARNIEFDESDTESLSELETKFDELLALLGLPTDDEEEGEEEKPILSPPPPSIIRGTDPIDPRRASPGKVIDFTSLKPHKN